MPKYILSLIYLIALSFNSFADNKLEVKLDPFLGKPFLEIQPLFKGERFVNIVVTMDGTFWQLGEQVMFEPSVAKTVEKLGARNRYCQALSTWRTNGK